MHSIRTRDAEKNDVLVTTRFHTRTNGFSSPSDRQCAVCLKPGTEIVFEKRPKHQEFAKLESFMDILGLFFWLRAPSRTATFRQVNLDQRETHHDALEFEGGRIIKLHHLKENQMAHVVQLPMSKEKLEIHQPPKIATVTDAYWSTPRGEHGHILMPGDIAD